MTPFRLSSRVAPSPSRGLPRGLPVARPRPVLPGGSSPPHGAAASAAHAVAHPVPWRVASRSARGVIEFEQLGGGPLRAVRVSLAGGGMLGLSLPRTVYPGERLRVVLRGASRGDALDAPDAMLVLRWFQPDGTELLWPIAL